MRRWLFLLLALAGCTTIGSSAPEPRFEPVKFCIEGTDRCYDTYMLQPPVLMLCKLVDDDRARTADDAEDVTLLVCAGAIDMEE